MKLNRWKCLFIGMWMFLLGILNRITTEDGSLEFLIPGTIFVMLFAVIENE